MQLMKDFFQVGGSLNGITWTGNDASYDDCNTYILKTDEGLIMLTVVAVIPWNRYLIICYIGI